MTESQTVESVNVTDNVTDRLAVLRKTVSENNKISTIKLAKLLNISKRTVLRDIEMLKKQGILKRIGTEKGGYWQVVEKSENS